MTQPARLKRVPGRARPRREVLAEFEKAVAERKKRIKPELWFFFIPDAEKQYRWRVQLSCGCVDETLTNGRDHFPDEREFYDPVTQSWLPKGEMWCRQDHGRPKPYRDIVEWGERSVHDFPPDPEVDPHGMEQEVWEKIRHSESHSSASWRVKLSCGHYGSVCTDLDWKPEDGPTLATVERTQEMREEFEAHWNEGGPDAWPAEGVERDHMRRTLGRRWPRPNPEQDCYTCAHVSSIVAYQRIGWLKPPPKPAKPPKPERERLQEQLQRAEAEAARIREQLKDLE